MGSVGIYLVRSHVKLFLLMSIRCKMFYGFRNELMGQRRPLEFISFVYECMCVRINEGITSK